MVGVVVCHACRSVPSHARFSVSPDDPRNSILLKERRILLDPHRPNPLPNLPSLIQRSTKRHQLPRNNPRTIPVLDLVHRVILVGIERDRVKVPVGKRALECVKAIDYSDGVGADAEGGVAEGDWGEGGEGRGSARGGKGGEWV